MKAKLLELKYNKQKALIKYDEENDEWGSIDDPKNQINITAEVVVLTNTTTGETVGVKFDDVIMIIPFVAE
jgi:hypothetical protein